MTDTLIQNIIKNDDVDAFIKENIFLTSTHILSFIDNNSLQLLKWCIPECDDRMIEIITEYICELGSLQMIRYLLENNFKLNFQNVWFISARGSIDGLQLLDSFISQGKNIFKEPFNQFEPEESYFNMFGEHFLKEIIMNDKLEMSLYLIQKYNIKYDLDKMYYEALCEDSPVCAKYFHSIGAKMIVDDPFLSCCVHGCSKAIIEFLLSLGYFPNDLTLTSCMKNLANYRVFIKNSFQHVDFIYSLVQCVKGIEKQFTTESLSIFLNDVNHKSIMNNIELFNLHTDLTLRTIVFNNLDKIQSICDSGYQDLSSLLNNIKYFKEYIASLTSILLECTNINKDIVKYVVLQYI
jgi:hypothetical protein